MFFLPTRKFIIQNKYSDVIEAISWEDTYDVLSASNIEDCFLVRFKKDPELDLEKCPQELKNLLSFIYG